MKTAYDILLSKVYTERTTALADKARAYTFRVAIDSNKHEIAQAVETAYGVKVKSVNTIVVRGKMRRARLRQGGFTPTWKKAVVKLAEGQTIDFG